jgi:kynurenine 3-monooxygenase
MWFRSAAIRGSSMFPFLGQGLNAGLEDVSVLLDCLIAAEHQWGRALVEYQRLRKPNCDAVTDIAAAHYRELAEATRDPKFVLRKRLETRLGELFPQELQSAYHVVSFSDRPYLEAQRAAVLQDQIVDRILAMNNIDQDLESGAIDAALRSLARAVLASAKAG